MDYQHFRYESPLEEEFARNFFKYISDKVSFATQHEVKTDWGTFRLDFAIQFNSEKVGIECDGTDYHDAFRDEFRDSLILGTQQVDIIYRFRGPDLFYHMEDCLYLLSQWEPIMFSKKGNSLLETLASDRIKEYGLKKEPGPRLFTYPGNRLNNEFNFMVIERRTKHGRQFWQHLFNFANHPSNYGKNVDELMQLYKQTQYHQ